MDLIGPFLLVPLPPAGSKERARAVFTLDVLKLNDRELLRAAREEAYGSYRARLNEYADRKEDGQPAERLQCLTDSLRRMGHPTVWQEIQRQHDKIEELNALFSRVPEAEMW